FLPIEMSEGQIRTRWLTCPHTEAFGLGRLSCDQFSERFVRDWGITLSPEEFAQEFRSWSRELFPGAADLLAVLRPRFRLASLSNSNELHWDRNTKDLGITGLFGLAISSHQVGLSKPDPRIYLLALERLAVPPGAVTFFDDVAENVDAARRLGMRSFQV